MGLLTFESKCFLRKQGLAELTALSSKIRRLHVQTSARLSKATSTTANSAYGDHLPDSPHTSHSIVGSSGWNRQRSYSTVAAGISRADFFRPNGELSHLSLKVPNIRLISYTLPLCHGASPISPRKRPSKFSSLLQLSKPRLTALIVLSSMSTYAVTPDALAVAVSEPASIFNSPLSTLLFLTAGTALTSACANALNMAREPVFDGMMSRTRARPIVRGLVSPMQAVIFAVVTGTTGALALYYGVNTEVAALAVFNIFLYAGMYTSMKRTSILNTWVGAVVGAIPPLMGWSAAGGSLADPGVWCFAGLLYAWQFPHFNALSFPVREEYKMAGYRMTAWVNPVLNARVALRYSIAMIPLCFGMWFYGVTDRYFLADSAVVNIWLVTSAVQFWKDCRGTVPLKGATASARRLFWASIWQLPAVLVLAMIHKQGLWNGMFWQTVPDEEILEELYDGDQ
ncbi:UbiA prenyltransferase family-domain-containing protein [Limtongia smithiae]|uniref:UbiA prenyltransferase family-domain-containing protein n=1 Tax=Limtongia smithiae TaxID=1125753 RepID=UPI0034CFB1AA